MLHPFQGTSIPSGAMHSWVVSQKLWQVVTSGKMVGRQSVPSQHRVPDRILQTLSRLTHGSAPLPRLPPQRRWGTPPPGLAALVPSPLRPDRSEVSVPVPISDGARPTGETSPRFWTTVGAGGDAGLRASTQSGEDRSRADPLPSVRSGRLCYSASASLPSAGGAQGLRAGSVLTAHGGIPVGEHAVGVVLANPDMQLEEGGITVAVRGTHIVEELPQKLR